MENQKHFKKRPAMRYQTDVEQSGIHYDSQDQNLVLAFKHKKLKLFPFSLGSKLTGVWDMH